MQPEEHFHITLPVHSHLPPFQAASAQWLHGLDMMQPEEHFHISLPVHSHLPPFQAASAQWLHGVSLCCSDAYHSSHNVHIYCQSSQQVTVDYAAFWCNGHVAGSLTLLHNQQLGLAGLGSNLAGGKFQGLPLGWPYMALRLSEPSFKPCRSCHRDWDLTAEGGIKSERLGGCKPVLC